MTVAHARGGNVLHGDPRRSRALAPYVEKLRDWTASSSTHGSARIRVGGRTLQLESWERARLQQAFDGGDVAFADLSRLLAQGVALLTRCLVNLERCTAGDTASVTERYAVQGDLMLDAAIGLALLQESQAAIDALVLGGLVDEAKHLSEFRNKLHRTIGEVKLAIGEVERRRALKLSTGLVTDGSGSQFAVDRLSRDIADARAARESEHPESARRPPAPPSRAIRAARKRIPAPTPAQIAVERNTHRTRTLAGLLSVLALAWLVVVRLPGLATPEPRSAESAVCASRPELFVEVVDRRPSLFLTVHESEWERLDDSTRRQITLDSGRSALEAGYAGLVIRTADGRAVARWLRNTGVALLAPVEWPASDDAPEALDGYAVDDDRPDDAPPDA